MGIYNIYIIYIDLEHWLLKYSSREGNNYRFYSHHEQILDYIIGSGKIQSQYRMSVVFVCLFKA